MRQLLWVLLGTATGVALAFLLPESGSMLVSLATLGAIGIITGVVTARLENAVCLASGIPIGVTACFTWVFYVALSGGGGTIMGFGIGAVYGLFTGAAVLAFASAVILLRRHLAARKAKDVSAP